MGLFNELKRRNVIRVSLAYAVVAWVLLQVADLAMENFAAPEWVMKVLMLVMALGFPVAVIIAWAYELTPDGIKRDSEVDPNQSIAHSTGRKLDRITIIFLAVTLLLVLANPFGKQEPVQIPEDAVQDTTQPASTETQTTAKRDNSVAILPFAFRSNNKDDEFFAAGMHDDLLTKLAKIKDLKVISRTSVMEYKDTTKKIPQIAEELGVGAIMEGGVQRSGTRIRINAQLIDASTDQHLWAETYNHELTAENLFEIQAEITRAIAAALHATLSPAEEVIINRALTNNLQAWEAYQRAIQMQQDFGGSSIRSGLAEIDHALELDPDFAAAWSLKAILLLQQYWFYDTDIALRTAAWEAIQRGRAINSTLAELGLAEGYYHYWGFRDYAKALPLMLKASTALPNSTRVHSARGFVLRRMGNWDAALAALRRAAELDPRNDPLWVTISETLNSLGRFAESRSALTNANTQSPRYLMAIARIDFVETRDLENYSHFAHLNADTAPNTYFVAWGSSLYLKDFKAALEDVAAWPEKFLESKDRLLTRAMLLGLTHRYAGDLETARPLLLQAKQELEALLEEAPQSFGITSSLCLVAGGLGNISAAKTYCKNSLSVAPKDAFFASGFQFDAATGLALAGDTQGAIKLLQTSLANDAGPTIYDVIYHPAFDRMREDPAYLELLEKYGSESL